MHLEEGRKTKLLNMVRSISEINIHYIRQKHMRGLGDAIRCAQSFIADEPLPSSSAMMSSITIPTRP